MEPGHAHAEKDSDPHSMRKCGHTEQEHSQQLVFIGNVPVQARVDGGPCGVSLHLSPTWSTSYPNPEEP